MATSQISDSDAPVTVGVVGSTGSIGTQTLELVAADPDRYVVETIATGSNVDLLTQQAAEFRPRYVAIATGDCQGALRDAIAGLSSPRPQIIDGPDALAELSSIADVTVNGVVGFAGLSVTLGCLEAGKRLALANKESLIAAGPVVQKARLTPGAELIPVDSEHGAVHQCLRANDEPGRIKSIQITASGGPFRGKTKAELALVDVDEALKHPTWSMGPKITVDSSTLMNKGLEVIEAHELFGTPAGSYGVGLTLDDIDVVVHPQSIVHSMVTYSDGSTIAQLSNPDMKLPIGYALAYPDRFRTASGAIDWSTAGRLDFEPPDIEAFPCLSLAYEAGRIGGTSPAWLSAANEIAVEAFLNHQIRWIDIADVIETVMERQDGGTGETLEEVLSADGEARKLAAERVARLVERGPQ